MISDDTMTPTDEQNVQPPAESAGEAPEPDQPAPDQPEGQAPADQNNDPSAQAEEAAPAAAGDELAPELQAQQDEPQAEEAQAAPPQADQPQAQPTSEPKMTDAQLFEAAMDALESGEEAAYEGAYKKLSRGDRVEATVIQVDRDRVFVDLGTKSEGIVPLGELAEGSVDSASDHVKVGDKIQVVVLRPEGAEGNPVVSKKRADFEDAWDRIEQTFEEGKMINAQVVDRVKGGLVVDIGVRGFVPATHVGTGKLRNIEKFVGEPLTLKIIEIDREKKKVVLSNREAEEQRRAKAKEEIFQNVKPGAVLDGTVRRLTDYGAFVDLGGVDGLLHISEMSWMRINHPREMFKEGQKIKVMVLRLDEGTGKISLGHRQVLPDPWNLVRDAYSVGQRFTTKISRMVVSGAFVKLPEGAEAFIPVSEMSTRRIRKPEDVVEEGQEVEVQVLDLRPDERRMVLSMRATGSTPEPGRGGGAAPSYDDDDRGKRGMAGGKKGAKKKGGRRGQEDEYEDIVGRRGFATGGATIGERLGMLKGFALRDDELDESEEESSEDGTATEAAAPEPEAPAEANQATEAGEATAETEATEETKE
jgi:predicted RNA-binding protein with RPS1 domain